MKRLVIALVMCVVSVICYTQKIVKLNGMYVYSDDEYVLCDTTVKSYMYIKYRFNITYALYDTVFKEDVPQYKYDMDRQVYRNKVVNVKHRLCQEYLYSFKYKPSDFYSYRLKNQSKASLDYYKAHYDISKLDSVVNREYAVYDYSILPEVRDVKNISSSVLKNYKNVISIDTISADTIIESSEHGWFAHDVEVITETNIPYVKVFRNGVYLTSYSTNDSVPNVLTAKEGHALFKTNPVIMYGGYLVTESHLGLSDYGVYKTVYVGGMNTSDKMIKKVTYRVNFYNNIDEFKFSKELTVTGYTENGEWIGAEFDVFEKNVSRCKIVGVKVYYTDNSISSKFRERCLMLNDIAEWYDANVIEMDSKPF